MKRIILTALCYAGLGVFTALAAEATCCPVSSKPVDSKVSLNVNGSKVGFCCENCQAKLEKQLHVQDDGPGKCPMSGEPADKATRLLHSKTEAVYFCCEKCAKKYAEENKIEVADSGPGKCPVSGEPAEAGYSTVHNGKKVYFCCNKCAKKYAKDNHVLMAKTEPGKCPVSGEPAEAEHVLYQTKTKAVYFCCDKCAAKYVQQEIDSRL